MSPSLSLIKAPFCKQSLASSKVTWRWLLDTLALNTANSKAFKALLTSPWLWVEKYFSASSSILGWYDFKPFWSSFNALVNAWYTSFSSSGYNSKICTRERIAGLIAW